MIQIVLIELIDEGKTMCSCTHKNFEDTCCVMLRIDRELKVSNVIDYDQRYHMIGSLIIKRLKINVCVRNCKLSY